MKFNTILFFTFVLLLNSCTSNKETLSFTQKFGKVYQKEEFLSKGAVQFDLKLDFATNEKINARLIMLNNVYKRVIAYANGAKITFDDNKVFYSPTMPNETSVRYDAYTGGYLFHFPNKLSYKEKMWTSYLNKEKDSEKYFREKVAIVPETGNASYDSYVVFATKNSNIIEKATYYVTLQSGKDDAEKNLHATQYKDHKEISGISIATKWRFCRWKEGIGLTDELGRATLTNIELMKVDTNYFKTELNFKTS